MSGISGCSPGTWTGAEIPRQAAELTPSPRLSSWGVEPQGQCQHSTAACATWAVLGCPVKGIPTLPTASGEQLRCHVHPLPCDSEFLQTNDEWNTPKQQQEEQPLALVSGERKGRKHQSLRQLCRAILITPLSAIFSFNLMAPIDG